MCAGAILEKENVESQTEDWPGEELQAFIFPGTEVV
jgi:hypothetical protein